MDHIIVPTVLFLCAIGIYFWKSQTMRTVKVKKNKNY